MNYFGNAPVLMAFDSGHKSRRQVGNNDTRSPSANQSCETRNGSFSFVPFRLLLYIRLLLSVPISCIM